MLAHLAMPTARRARYENTVPLLDMPHVGTDIFNYPEDFMADREALDLHCWRVPHMEVRAANCGADCSHNGIRGFEKFRVLDVIDSEIFLTVVDDSFHADPL